MYGVLLFVLIAAGAMLLVAALAGGRRWLAAAGALVIVATVALFGLMDLWGEMLWFEAVGYADRFWTMIVSATLAGVVGAAIGWLVVYVLTWPIPKHPATACIWPELAGIVLGAVWGGNNWETLLRYWYGITTEVIDPILGRDTGFYLFSLPFYDALYGLLLLTTWVSLIAALAFLLVPRGEQELNTLRRQQMPQRRFEDYRGIYCSIGGMALVLAWGQWLNIFHLMNSQWGVVSGPGWTDVTIRLPGYWIVAGAMVVAAAVLLIPPATRRLHAWSTREEPPLAIGAVLLPIVGVGAIWFLALSVAPALVQWLVVEPNEISREKPYIEHNIEFTQRGFQLDKIEHRAFPVRDRFDQELADRNRDVLSQVRLWDPRALVEVYKQFQEIRLYYEFPDVDVDRYTIDGRYRQVMVSPREMRLENLSEQSQTFVNRHFKYTHGYGITMAPVSEFTSDGLPDLLIKDIPPQSTAPDLRVDEPAIYYGLLTDTYAVVNTKEEEFDYPRGQQNAYVRYEGQGGVQLSNLWRTFIYGWKLGGTRLFFSGYPTAESRIMFHRQVRDRVNMLAPFLEFDRDPYIVLAEGRLYWIIDAYTTSRRYPYSEPFRGESEAVLQGEAFTPSGRTRRTAQGPADRWRGMNYVRNSVKAVVDAYNGSVDFYIFEPDDPLIRVWERVFPGLLKPRSAMPEALVKHIRYPEDLLLTQGLVYAKYHMTDPEVFYNQEDLWIRATEKYYGSVQPVEPYYVMWKPPSREDREAAANSEDRNEFIQMLPFTPKNRQVLIGWIAGMCDPDNYGRLLAYRFPKEKRVLGTQQVETKIDQDSHLAGQLTLWDQRGSNVIRGNVLVIPIGETILYVEPIYLQAEASAYPELRLVVLMHNDRISYAETFEEALEGLYGERPGLQERLPEAPTAPGKRKTLDELIQQAGTAFDDYVSALSEKRFRDAGQSLETLSETLERLRSESGDGADVDTKPPAGPNADVDASQDDTGDS